jgi:hypothetical protein
LQQEESTESKSTKKPKRPYRWLRRLGRTFLGIILFLLALVLFIRSPWGQDIIVGQLVDYVKGKTDTEVEIEKLFITFDGDIELDGLYLEDTAGDTLVYSRSLEAAIPLWPLISGGGISIDDVEWEGLTARISRQDTISGFNFQFLVDAFATVPNTTQTSQPLNLTLGDFQLADFDIVFKDQVANLDARSKFDRLNLAVTDFDMETYGGSASNLFLENAEFYFEDSNAPPLVAQTDPETSAQEPTVLPTYALENLELRNVAVTFVSRPQNLDFKTDVGSLTASVPEADTHTSTYRVDGLELVNSTTRLLMNDSAVATPSTSSSASASEWPPFFIEATGLQLTNNNFFYSRNGAQVQQGKFNPDVFDIDSLTAAIPLVRYQPKNATLELEQLSLMEASGIVVRNLSAFAKADNSNITLQNLDARVNQNILQGDAAISYNGVQQLIDNPTDIRLDVDLDRYKIDLRDIYRFQPDLKQNEYFAGLAKRPLSGNLTASGDTDLLDVNNFNVNWGRSTQLQARGALANLLDVKQLKFNLPNIQATSTRADLITFIPESQLGIRLPESFDLDGSLLGGLDDIKTDAQLTTSYGNVMVDGNFATANGITFDANVKTVELDLGTIMQNPSLGKINLTVTGSGSGSTINSLDATVDATVQEFSYNDYPITGLQLSAGFQNGRGSVTSQYKDENINAQLDGAVALDSINTRADLALNIKGLNMNAVGITRQDVRAGGIINASFQGNATNYEIGAQIEDGVAVFDKQSYLLGSFKAHAYVQPDTTALQVRNRILDLDLESNTDPLNLANGLQRHIDRYLNREIKMDSITPVVMRIDGDIRPTPLLRDVILPQLESLDTLHIGIDFNEKERRLKTDIEIPYVKYAGIELDSLYVRTRSDSVDLNTSIGFKHLMLQPIDIQRTAIEGRVANNQLELDFTSYDGDERLVHFASSLSRRRGEVYPEPVEGPKRDENDIDNLIFKLDLEDLIFNKRKWTVPESNEMQYGENRIRFKDFVLSSADQSLEVRSDLPEIEKDHIGLIFNGFRLQNLLAILNPDQPLATGKLNGQIVLEDVLTKMGFEADAQIIDLAVLETPLGKLDLEAQLQGGNNYTMDLSVQGPDVDLNLGGSYVADATAAQLDLKLNVDRMAMSTVAGFSQEFLKDGEGYFTADVNISGTTIDPVYDGNLTFKDAGINVAMLNNKFYMDDQSLKLSNELIEMSDFTIKDEFDNSIVIDGSVGTEQLLNPTFDLRVNAKEFMALNSTEDDNELYYGKAVFDVDATITGDLKIPKVRADLRVDAGTNVTYVVPPTSLDVVQRDGIVEFVNKDNPDNILTQTEETAANVTGFDIDTTIRIEEGAIVNIITDPLTNGKLNVNGSGSLDFKMTPNGRMRLAGIYTIADGFYQLNLYEIVNRKFELVPGGTVRWTGDPYDAQLDVKARYTVETSASALMAAQTSGSNLGTQQRFRQELPFQVYVNVEGELMAPEIAFRLDMPEDEQGYASGQVYGRLQQLNDQPGALNKQVFSLLVLNRFFPTAGADGSSGGAVGVARDNINQVLSDQLNQFGGELLGDTGVELNFGLDSYTDYQGATPQDRTQLEVTASKKLLDDRLIVNVGSNVDVEGSPADGESTPVIGNVSLEYLLTTDGRWRLKGFRKNQFDNVVDGQLIISGIALIFKRDFNKFSNLFRKTDEEKQAEAEQKAIEARREERQESERQRQEEIEREKKNKANG